MQNYIIIEKRAKNKDIYFRSSREPGVTGVERFATLCQLYIYRQGQSRMAILRHRYCVVTRSESS